MLEAYRNMWRHYANFSCRTTMSGYWSAVFTQIVVLIAFAVLGSAIPILQVLAFAYALASLIPVWAITVRRLRDVGKRWYYILVSGIPLIGGLYLIYLLTRSSVIPDGTPNV